MGAHPGEAKCPAAAPGTSGSGSCRETEGGAGPYELGRHKLHAREEAVTQPKPVTTMQGCRSSSCKIIYFSKEAKNTKFYISNYLIWRYQLIQKCFKIWCEATAPWLSQTPVTLSCALGLLFWGLEVSEAWSLPTNLPTPLQSPNSSQVTAARAKVRKTAAFWAAGGSLPESHTHGSWAGRREPGGCSTVWRTALNGIQPLSLHSFSRGRNIPCLCRRRKSGFAWPLAPS